jgi:hypothetical protein
MLLFMQGSYTLSSRHSYCEGIASGLHKFVKNNLLQEERKMAEKLTRARERLENPESHPKKRRWCEDQDTAEAKEGVDDENDSDSDSSDEEDEDDCKASGYDDENEDEDDIPVVVLLARKVQRKKELEEAARQRLHRLEEEQKVSGALVIHMENVAEKVLKNAEIKLTKKKGHSRIETNRDAWSKGYADSKEIDLNQRAITSKGEKKRKRV